jgi:uncharacterized membrane protein
VNPEIIALLIIIVTVLSVLWLSRQKVKWVQQVLDWVPPILFSYVIPASITHLFRLDLSSVQLHSISRDWIIPMAIITVMSSLSFLKLKQVGAKPVFLFVCGSFAIAVLAPALVGLFGLFWPASKEVFITQGYWRGLVPIVGSWIGGSTSQLVMKELVNCPESLFLSVIVLDNILVNGWTILMFQVIKKSDRLNRWFKILPPLFQSVTNDPDANSKKSIWITSFLILLGTYFITLFTKDFLLRIALLSVAGLALGNLISKWDHSFVLKAGGILIIIIMSILGLRLDFTQLTLPVPFIVLCLVWLIGHFVFMMIIAKLMNIHMAWVPIASMANVGGISTAPAVASAYHKDWMPHAILLAIVSMVSSNVWGLLSVYLFNWF